MRFVSLNNPLNKVSFHDALLQGIASDGGLFVPEAFPLLSNVFYTQLKNQSLFEIAATMMKLFLTEIPQDKLQDIIRKTFHFPIPLVELRENLFLLELFHGPTLAFKDVGARFMAEILSYFLEKEREEITILVATSGDTGSAVAQGFFNIPHVRVYILYPSKMMTHLQEQQMTTLGGNIYPIEIRGTFDDCQQLVKKTLSDSELKSRYNITTANSINIARLLPQMVYYMWGIAELQKKGISIEPAIVVPSGNFGNLTAAAYAKAIGAPISSLVAAVNSNNIVSNYLKTGEFEPRSAIHTLSNAMDVGNPSNFARLQALYDYDFEKIRDAILGISISDEQTIEQIKKTYYETGYILDPHTAVGVAASNQIHLDQPVIVASTAHPAKFGDVIKRALGMDIPLPEGLKKVVAKQKISHIMNPDFEEWKVFLEKRQSLNMQGT